MVFRLDFTEIIGVKHLGQFENLVSSASLLKIGDRLPNQDWMNDYSLFKYGSRSRAMQFGYAMADLFFSENPFNLNFNNPVAVIPSPYSHIRTAAVDLTDHFVDRLNYHFYLSGIAPVRQIKIHRTTTYATDYGELTAQQRQALIANDTFHLDRNAILGHQAVCIDDIRITGTHHELIDRLFESLGLQTHFMFIAEIVNPLLPANYENTLNYAYVTTLDEISELIEKDDFLFNTRAIKFILGQKSHEFDAFIMARSMAFKRLLFSLAIGNEYQRFPQFTVALKKLSDVLLSNGELTMFLAEKVDEPLKATN